MGLLTMSTVRFSARQHSQHAEQTVLLVANEANPPVSHPESILGGCGVSKEHHIALPGPRKQLHRVDDSALGGRVEPLQVSSSAR
jgi:hypothetical protein